MDIKKIYEILCRCIPCKQILINESMKKHTSFRIGGPADIMVLPSEIKHIECVMKECNKFDVPVFVMGNGSNLLVRDKGIRGVVVKIAECFNDIHISDTYIKAKSGVLMSSLSKAAVKKSLTGLEFASGIPGTLGGAVTMNAGAYGGEMKDVVESVKVMDCQGAQSVLSKDDLCFGYRKSYIQQKGLIVLEVKLHLEYGDYEQSMSLIRELGEKRRTKQPLSFPSAGSTFKRPVGYYAGKLIQDAGLKGMRVGDAQISDLHAGFIINLGNATAKDVIQLIELVKEKIKKEFNVEMYPEVKIVGEE